MALARITCDALPVGHTAWEDLNALQHIPDTSTNPYMPPPPTSKLYPTLSQMPNSSSTEVPACCIPSCNIPDPQYNYPGLPAKYCFKHKQQGMVDVIYDNVKPKHYTPQQAWSDEALQAGGYRLPPPRFAKENHSLHPPTPTKLHHCPWISISVSSQIYDKETACSS